MKKGKTRSVLGRGLEALIPTGSLDAAGAGIADVDIDRISPNARQPRDRFAQESLQELAQSIRENGIIQPLIVRPQGDDYMLVAGERRWRAAQLAGLKRVPVVVKDVADEKLLQVALVENIQRQDLSPLEMAKAFRMLCDDHHLTQEQVAERVGMKRPSVTNYLRLLSLAEPVREALDAGRLDMGHARALGGVEDRAVQVQILQAVLKGALSVRQAELMVHRAKAGEALAQLPPAARKDPHVAAAETRLQRVLGSRVRIVRGSGGAGKIVIRFRSDEDLDRLFALLTEDPQIPTGSP